MLGRAGVWSDNPTLARAGPLRDGITRASSLVRLAVDRLPLTEVAGVRFSYEVLLAG